MRILVTGQCTVHWGRLEYGNIGNYYITEALFRELHRVFPAAEVVTTFQMTEEFCLAENVSCLPMELFYSWSENDLARSLEELGIATLYASTGRLPAKTPFIKEVMKSDLVIDFSGEMWGDHAEPVGKSRFLVGLIKDRVAQLLGKPVVLLAGSQGPFTDAETKGIAQEVFRNFRLVLNREEASEELLRREGFDVSRVSNFTCPAFLFEGTANAEIADILALEGIGRAHPTVGFCLCGFNMLEGPYDKAPRRDEEFTQFAEVVEFIVGELGAHVFLMSHQNGFERDPAFKLINGRDYPYARQLHDVVARRGKVSMDKVNCLRGPYGPAQTKAIIRQFDMFVSGRIHAFVAAVSQSVPTVIITRGHGGVSHRNLGFARSVGLADYVADPASVTDMKAKIAECWARREALRAELGQRMAGVRQLAHDCFDALREIFAPAVAVGHGRLDPP
jgi:colanic acid/amylovoran biosynthesis protein